MTKSKIEHHEYTAYSNVSSPNLVVSTVCEHCGHVNQSQDPEVVFIKDEDIKFESDCSDETEFFDDISVVDQEVVDGGC